MLGKEKIGSIVVLTSYVMWGSLTLFWALLSGVNPIFLLAQRIVWAMVFTGLIILVGKNFDEIISVFRNRKNILICFVCGILITINWGVYIYALTSNHVIDASLGYFIEPVMVALIGVIAFREKMNKFEIITFIFAVLGLLYMLISSKTVPAMSLIIAGSFAIYGAIKKNLEISARASLFMETLVMVPFAVAYIIYAEKHSIGAVGVLNSAQMWLLPICGVITALPLLFFNIGVKNIQYYILGILMYINPTIQFLIGHFYFHEELDRNRLISFIFIWIGILFTMFDRVKKLLSDKRISNKI